MDWISQKRRKKKKTLICKLVWFCDRYNNMDNAEYFLKIIDVRFMTVYIYFNFI